MPWAVRIPVRVNDRRLRDGLEAWRHLVDGDDFGSFGWRCLLGLRLGSLRLFLRAGLPCGIAQRRRILSVREQCEQKGNGTKKDYSTISPHESSPSNPVGEERLQK